jgi:putative addiction module component (TIGR02574 family)
VNKIQTTCRRPVKMPSILANMTNRAKSLLDEAMRLPPDERAEMARKLLASTEGPVDAEAEAEWLREIERRAEEAEAPDWQGESWEVVQARIKRQLRGK